MTQDFATPRGVITVEYTIEGYNSPTTYDPVYGAVGGDGAEFSINEAWLKDTEEPIELQDEEREKHEAWLAENIDPNDSYDPEI